MRSINRCLLPAAAGILSLLAACGGSTTVSPAAPAASAAPANDWAQLTDAARKEGKVVVKGPPTAAVRTDVTAAFKQRFGVDVDYTGGQSGDAVVQLASERKAGQYTTDVILAGADTMYGQIYGQKMLDPLLPALTVPEAKDASKWPNGKLWFMDPEGQYVLRLDNSLGNIVQINTDAVQPGAIKSMNDLLKPEYQGKIASFDPAVSGRGLSDATYMTKQLGAEWVRKLYVDQKVTFSRDHRELADWLGRGKFPIVLSLREVEFEKLRADKLPVAYVQDLPEAPGSLSAGFGLMGLMNNAPHPSAAKLFVNWLASKEGMAAWSKAELIVPVRTDIDTSIYPRELVPQAGRQYFDGFAWDWVMNERKQTQEQLQKLLR